LAQVVLVNAPCSRSTCPSLVFAMAFFGFGGQSPPPRYNTVGGGQAGSGAFMSNGGVFSSGGMPAGAMGRGVMNGGHHHHMNGGTINQGWNGDIATTTYVDLPELRTVDKFVEVPEIEIQEVVKNVPKYQYVENVVTVPRREVQYVERVVEVPEVHQIVEVPRIEYQEVIRTIPKKEVQQVEKVVEVPETITTERIVEVPEFEVQEVVRTVPKVEYQYLRQGFDDRQVQPAPAGPSFSCNGVLVLGLMVLALIAAIIPLAIIRFRGQAQAQPAVQSEERTVTTAVTGSPFDCDAGFGNWEQGWTDAKKLVCCKFKACGTQLTTVSEAFDCDLGFSSWQQGWSYNKKQYCCTQHQKGCTE